MANFDVIDERPTWNGVTTPKITDRIRGLYETSKWHDCVFKLFNSDGVGEELVFAHAIVLASSSPVFEALCFGPMAERKATIEVPDVDPNAFRAMLRFIYTDAVEFGSVELACNVLYAAKKYLIYTLAGLAIAHISSHVNETNCLQIYRFAGFVQEDRLARESWSYLCSHLDDVLDYFTRDSLTTDLVTRLVSEDALNGGEILVYKICQMWAELECESQGLERTGENLRKMLVRCDLFDKIRWLTLTENEFEEGPAASGILTCDEVEFIRKHLPHAADMSLKADGVENNDPNAESECKVPKLNSSDLGSDPGSASCPMTNLSAMVKARKRIQLKKFYCHRFIEREVRPNLSLKNRLKIETCITANRSVRLTAVFLNAKISPLLRLNTGLTNLRSVAEGYYTEKVVISICDSSNRTLFNVLFYEKVSYGTVFKIPLQTPVILERSKEYRILVDLLNFSENHLIGVRNSITKFPSGLCVTFRELANVGDDGKFVEANDLSIISGLELCL